SVRKMVEQIAESIRLGAVNDNSNRKQKGPGAAGIQVSRPDAGATVSSPVTVRGEARGNWYFEAEFTVDLVQDGKTLTTAIVKAQEDWMTDDYVDFSATFEIPEAAAEGKAQLVFRNSNPSGKPKLDKSHIVQVEVERHK
ncbi:MAG: Gmad2 immunoglobulin-like domain-containing protein, partial [Prolixibacteraceae bacterium]